MAADAILKSRKIVIAPRLLIDGVKGSRLVEEKHT